MTDYRALFEESLRAYVLLSRVEDMALRIDQALGVISEACLPHIFSNALRGGLRGSLTNYLRSDDERYSVCVEALDGDAQPGDSFCVAWKNTVIRPSSALEALGDTYRIFCGEDGELGCNGAVAAVMMQPFSLIQLFTEPDDEDNVVSIATEIDLFWSAGVENSFYDLCDMCDALLDVSLDALLDVSLDTQTSLG